MSRLEEYLVLNRYLHDVLGAPDFETLKGLLSPLAEGPDAGGQSHFGNALRGLPGSQIPADKLALYDGRIMAWEADLRQARPGFRHFRYFQYLALLYAEIFLDKLTDSPPLLLAELNAFLRRLKNYEPVLYDFPDFTAGDLRRLAFFMATGSGKTLLMHVNIRQILHYLRQGAHPEALLPGAAKTRRFDNIILITPNEGLSAQHIAELRASGLGAAPFIANPYAKGTSFAPFVKVIEIHKLAEKASKDGKSLVMESIGQNNLVIVDEGHKGTGSAAQTWKKRQKYLSGGGFLLEYSATFAQAIGAAGKKAKDALRREYGKAILFDYSYAHFYGDGFGKDFRVLNLKRAAARQAHELLVGGLLTFYHQLFLYRNNRAAFRPYNLEKPLWVLLGSSVNATYTRRRQKRSDVAELVAFLRRFLEEPDWAKTVMARILAGQSGFEDENGRDLFAPHIEYLLGQDAAALYDEMRQTVFRGGGGLEVWQIKQADGEFGLRLSQADEAAPYFGVINIGDAAAFRKYLAAHLGLTVQEDMFRPSQFDIVDAPDSPIYLLAGARKFIEGWSSWRVSSMGLLNVGKGEGSQIIQLFGRGVRLKGRQMSLKRSAALPGAQGRPPGIAHLETLSIFGWNADYIQRFQEFIENEDVPQELTLPLIQTASWPDKKLPLPETKPGFAVARLTWTLDDSGPDVKLDKMPQATAAATRGAGKQAAQSKGAAGGRLELKFTDPRYLRLLDRQALYHELLAYKRLRGYDNLYLPAGALDAILQKRCRVTLPAGEQMPETVQRAAATLLKSYMDRFVRMKERQAVSQNVQPGWLAGNDPRLQTEYRLRARGDQQLLLQLRAALNQVKSDWQYLPASGYYLWPSPPLPRLYFDRSLFNPLLLAGHSKDIVVSPPPLNEMETQFLQDLQQFWQVNHAQAAYRDCELYVLRNLAVSGISLFHRAGFYPDFILWLHNRQTAETKALFIEPHGLHHEGLSGNADKFAALTAVRALSGRPDFQKAQVTLDGYVLTNSKLEDIRDANGRDWPALEAAYPLKRMEGDYIRDILA